MTQTTTLTPGTRYDISTLRCVGWSRPDTDTDGYNCWDYFDAAGVYLGPDQDGVQPCFVRVEEVMDEQ